MAETKTTGAKKHITGARIAQEIKQYKKDALISPLYTVCCVILEILIPYLTASIIDKGIAVGNMTHVAKIGTLMAVMAILAMFFGVRAGVHSARASTGLASNLRESMFGRIQEYSFSNIDRFSTAGLVTRLTTDVTNIQNAFQMILQICTRAPVTLIVALFMAFSINAKLSLVFLVAMAFLGVMIFVLIPKAMKYFKLMFRKYDAVNGVVQENVGAIRVVKAFVREDYEDEKFSGAANALFKNSISAERIISFSMPIMQLTVYACILSISWFGAKMIVGQTGLTTGELTSLLSYVMNILMSLMMLSMIFVMVTMARASADRIAEVLEEKADLTSPPAARTQVEDGRVDFDHVSFSYKKSGKPVLDDIDLHIRAGETIGIIGGTGSAKSSLVQLIPRLYDVAEGAVRVGGVDVREYDVETLRNEVAMVLQKNELFSGTIAENLRWGNKDATDAEIEEACKQACADEFIERFPDKYNTHIDQGGTNVSGGQKQRLCIARALLKKPRILILDDSTSAVDTGTDAKIRKSFAEKIPGTTVFIIAQRISSVENADHVIVLDNGRISGYGTPAEMLATNPIYQEVYNSQTKGSGDFDEKGGDNNG
mgnify:CR=1 FL=1